MQKLPDWAERALELHRPQVEHGGDEPNRNVLVQLQAVEQRFRTQWLTVNPDAWSVPAATDVRYLWHSDLVGGQNAATGVCSAPPRGVSTGSLRKTASD